ncbi:MAG: transposase [Bacteroidales bacterium]|nr:transposase [Bacteroidales bacterium]
MRKYYLVTTEHLKAGLWFRDENDFRAGMNFVAIQAYESKVTVLAFILMSNHLHFVVEGRWEDVKSFIDGIKSRYSKYLNHKYGTCEFLRRNQVRIEEVSSLDEGLEKAIAYTQMNCVAANVCSHPSQYPWGTGPVFFSTSKRPGKRMESLSKRARIRLFHCCKVDLPPCWLVSDEGYILPESYIDVAFVERLYRTPNRMNYFLVNSSKAKRKIENADDHHPAFRDQVILAALPDLYRSLFGKQRFEELTPAEQIESLRQIQRRFCSNIHQIARVTGLTYEDAARMMDSV